jgi:hypothetical protein
LTGLSRTGHHRFLPAQRNRRAITVLRPIRKVDVGLNWINLLILVTAALLPCPTDVLAGAFSEGATGSREAVVVLYAIIGAPLMSAAWIPVFHHLARHPGFLIDPSCGRLFANADIASVGGGR